MGTVIESFLLHVSPTNGPKLPVNIYCNNGYAYQNVLINEFDEFSLRLSKSEDPTYDACVLRQGICAIHTYRMEATRTINQPTAAVSQEVADMLG